MTVCVLRYKNREDKNVLPVLSLPFFAVLIL